MVVESATQPKPLSAGGCRQSSKISSVHRTCPASWIALWALRMITLQRTTLYQSIKVVGPPHCTLLPWHGLHALSTKVPRSPSPSHHQLQHCQLNQFLYHISVPITGWRFGLWTLESLICSNVIIRKPQKDIHGDDCQQPAALEILIKVSLAHSYPGFFRAGDLRRRSCFGPRMFS